MSKSVEMRFVVLTDSDLTWYHNEEEFKQQKPLGTIPLSYIYSISSGSKSIKDSFDIYIGAGQWRKKN
jgi:hypothetical protein